MTRGSTAKANRVALARSFYEADALEVAPLLLNKLFLGRQGTVGRVTEVEAYRGRDDPASHAHRGPTRRNATMFCPGGRLYVYFTYGMHFCANAVCGPDGEPGAVLVRGVLPLEGIDHMRAARRAWRGRDVADDALADGPAKLCQSFGITASDNGADLVSGDRGIYFADDGTLPPERPEVTPRIGVSSGRELPWRFALAEPGRL